MSPYMDLAMDMMAAAKPASGFRPETQAEWLKLLRAYEEVGYAMCRMAGLDEIDARCLARRTFGSTSGLKILDIGFRESSHE